MKNNELTGPSSIPTKFLKLLQNSQCKSIYLTANISLSTGNSPSVLKTANVIPIFQKDDHTLCNNYCPISRLSNISNIIEKLIHVPLTTFLNANNIHYKKQFRFRHNHSTTHAHIKIVEKIKQVRDSGPHACALFLDLLKAFDTVNHDILLKKLNHYQGNS